MGTAFFASLRTNLRLHASPPPSPVATPPSMRSSTSTLPPPSPLSQAVDSVMGDQIEMDLPPPAEGPLVGVPELRTYKTNSDEDKVAALQLTADSIVQMRGIANNALIKHPLNLVIGVAVLGLVASYIHDRKQDNFWTGTTSAGLAMAILTAFRYMTRDYLFWAEEVNFDWLDDAEVLVTKFGDEVIGTVVLEWVSGEGRHKRKKAWRGEIRAWTVRLKYRKKGVGGALLEEAVKEARRKGAESLDFADDHASKSSCAVTEAGCAVGADGCFQIRFAYSLVCTIPLSTSESKRRGSCSRICSKRARRVGKRGRSFNAVHAPHLFHGQHLSANATRAASRF